MNKKGSTGNHFSFFLQGRPVPWARARVGRHGHFTPPKQRNYKLAVSSFFLSKVKRPLEGPLSVEIEIRLLRAHSNKTLNPISRNTSDIDNWAKMFLDAGNGALWLDDAQIVDLCARKKWVLAAQDEGAFLTVREYGAITGNSLLN